LHGIKRNCTGLDLIFKAKRINTGITCGMTKSVKKHIISFIPFEMLFITLNAIQIIQILKKSGTTIRRQNGGEAERFYCFARQMLA